MMEIPLSKGQIALVDDDDYGWVVTLGPWHASKSNDTFYAFHSVDSRTKLLMHRCITNAPPGVKVDHMDWNGLNNQRHNLRLANNSQNAVNAPLSKKNTSGYRGVVWYPRYQKWVAQTSHGEKHITIGYFNSKEEAARAYAIKAVQLFGEFCPPEVAQLATL